MKKEYNLSKLVSRKNPYTELLMLQSVTISEKISKLESEDYLETRAKRGSLSKFKKILAKAPDVEPEPRDQI